MTNKAHIDLLKCGVEFFPALIAAIDAAEHEIFLETYIFSADPTGEKLAAALIAAAGRKVAVHLMIDGFGSKEYPKEKRRELEEGGVRLRIYRPGFFNFRFLRTGIRRLHRKLVVIDRQLAFVGGINILHDFDPGSSAPRYDYALSIRGPLVADVLQAVQRLWWLVSWSQLKRRETQPAASFPLPADSAAAAALTATLVLRDNLHHRRDIEKAYLQAIQHASQRIIIANAYFLPGRKLRRALLNAARRGVQISLLLQGRIEYPLQHYASQHLYTRLMRAGIRIHLYRPALLHAKVAVIDDAWATVGSSNMDPFSLQLAREANVVIEDAAFTTHLAEHLQETIRNDSDSVSPDTWLALPPLRRLRMFLSYQVLRLTRQLATREH